MTSKKQKVILAHGEVTGHMHQMAGGTDTSELIIEDNRNILSVKTKDNLVHEEHTTHTFEPGNAEVTIQAQYVMGELQRAAD